MPRIGEDAVWAPLTNAVSTFVGSERTENVQVHAQCGIPSVASGYGDAV
jgi:hypothetical protein